MTRGMSVLAAVALAAVTGLGFAVPAAAHSSQIGSSPEADVTVATVPAEVSVDFDTPLLDVGAAMVVRTDGRTVSVDPPTVGRRSISIDIDPDAPAGEYTVAYRVVSADGHTIESTFGFTVSGPSPEAAASAAATIASEPAGSPPYLLIGIGIAALLALLVGALALSR